LTVSSGNSTPPSSSAACLALTWTTTVS